MLSVLHKPIFKGLLCGLFSFFAYSQNALAQGDDKTAASGVSCSMSISYDYVPRAEQKKAGSQPEKASEKNSKAEAAKSQDAASVEKRSVAFRQMRQLRESEEEARHVLKEQAFSVEQEALAACKTKHENLSGCVSAKLSSQQGMFTALDFSARRALQQAIQEDCRLLQGTCLGASRSEAECVNLGGEEGKKDKKK